MKKFFSLLVLGLSTTLGVQAQCTDLFFSEYVEGAGSDKAVEIYNPTGADINLSDYVLRRYANGSPTPTETSQLTGTIPTHCVWVVTNGQKQDEPLPGGGTSPAASEELRALADQHDGTYPSPCYFNGDDALTIEKKVGASYVIVDIFGKIGEQPVPAWSTDSPYTGAGRWITKDYTLVRKPSVSQGVSSNPTEFIVMAEWDTFPRNDWSHLRKHTTTSCGSCDTSQAAGVNDALLASISIYPNPSSNGMISVRADQPVKTATFVNLMGQTVLKLANANFTNDWLLEVKALPAGVYLLQLSLTDDRTIAKKIVIE